MGEIALGDPPRWKRLGNSLCTNLSPPRRTNPSRPYANASLAFLRQNGVHRFPLSTLSRASAFLSSLHLFLSDLLFRPLYTWRVRSHRTTVILHRARVRNFARIFLSLPLFLLLFFPPSLFLVLFLRKAIQRSSGTKRGQEGEWARERDRCYLVEERRENSNAQGREWNCAWDKTKFSTRLFPYSFKEIINHSRYFISNDCFILRYA